MAVGALSPDGLVRVNPIEYLFYVGALSPDGLVRVTPLENLCACSVTRWVGESDSNRIFMWVLCHQTS